MGKKILNILVIIMAFCCLWVFIQGLRTVFHTEKAYKETGKNVYHSTPYCETIEGLGSFDEEYLRETKDVPGTEEMSDGDAYKDLDLEMCPFCYSPLERKARAEYLQRVIDYRNNKKTE